MTTITPAEEAIYKADFAKFDTNGSGALDGDEMAAMAKFQLGGDASDDQVSTLIAEMDTNADGKIELTEYLNKLLGPGWTVEGAGSPKPQGVSGNLEALLGFMDIDDNGRIDNEEARAFVQFVEKGCEGCRRREPSMHEFRRQVAP